MAKKSLEERIEGAKGYLKENLNTVRAGRANPELLDKINASLKKLQDSGKIDEIIGKYIKAE